MTVRTTLDIPEPMYRRLQHQAESSGLPVRSLILKTLEHCYADPVEKSSVTGPMVLGTGKLGPRFPTDKNPHDLTW